jgi:sugar phosphate isomerase/epimerase
MAIYLGAQLYTVRDFMRDEAAFAATLKKIAGIGYKNIQVSGAGDVSARCIKDEAERNGLGVVLTHTDSKRIREETDKVIADHDLFSCKGIGVGGMGGGYGFDADGIDRFTSDMAPAVEKIKAAGKVFLYHNHRNEFTKIDGRYAIERMLDNTDPEGFKLTLDIFWAAYSGIDCADFIRRYHDRIYCTHLKDIAIRGGEAVMTEVLEGNINFDPVIDMCKKYGIEWHLVEQDDTYGRDPFESLKISYDNLTERYDFR